MTDGCDLQSPTTSHSRFTQTYTLHRTQTSLPMPSPPSPAATPTVEFGDVVKPDITDATTVMHLAWPQGTKEIKVDYYAGNYENITKRKQYRKVR